EKPEPPPPRDKTVCVDWTSDREPHTLGPEYAAKGFLFHSLHERPLRVVTWGAPQGEGKLAFWREGVSIRLPCRARRVMLLLGLYTGEPVEVRAMNEAGSGVAEAGVPQQRGQQPRGELSARGMER